MQSRREYNPFHNALDTSKKLSIKPWYNSSQSGQLKIFSQSNTSSGDPVEVAEGESSRTRYRTALTSVDVVNPLTWSKVLCFGLEIFHYLVEFDCKSPILATILAFHHISFTTQFFSQSSGDLIEVAERESRTRYRTAFMSSLIHWLGRFTVFSPTVCSPTSRVDSPASLVNWPMSNMSVRLCLKLDLYYDNHWFTFLMCDVGVSRFDLYNNCRSCCFQNPETHKPKGVA